MNLAGLDREGIKAELRRRHGSTFAFERARGLPARSVSDTLRGKPNARVAQAIEEELATEPPALSDMSDDSAESGEAHRLSAEGR